MGDGRRCGSPTGLPGSWGISLGGLYVASGLIAFLFLVGLVQQQAADATVGYGLSLLAVVGAIGCLGCLLVLVSRRLPLRPIALLGVSSPATQRAGVRGEDWPLLVALLFGPFFVLLAGLGGWV